MASKITVTGEVRKVRKLQNPSDSTVQWVCLEIITGGSPNGPKGLPMPSQDIHFTVLMNTKQYKKLKDSSSEAKLKVEGSKVVIEGELILDLSFEILEGDIGVICFKAENIDAAKRQKEIQVAEVAASEVAKAYSEVAVSVAEAIEEPQVYMETQETQSKVSHMIVGIASIQIPSEFLETSPREEKISKAQQFYEKHGDFDKDIVLVEGEYGWILKDGYARYIAAKRMGLEEIRVACENI